MIVSIDVTGLGGVKTGTAVYVTEILQCWNRDKRLLHEFVIFSSPKTAGYLRTLGLDERFWFVDAPDSRAARILWQQLIMPWKIRKLGTSVHWGCGFVLPLVGSKPMVVTIYDLTFQLFPAIHERVKRYYFPAMISAAVRKAQRVIAISATTERNLHSILPASRGKTSVTLLAPRNFSSPAEPTLRAAPGLGAYVVCLGTLEPRKNLPRLLDAWLGMTEDERAGVKLIVVGVRGWMIDQLLARHMGEGGSVKFTGFLDDAELGRLMTGAMAMAYPSLYEGFGLPVLEAMSLGVPVLTSDVGATREISGGAALLVDPSDVVSIRQGLRRLLSEEPLRARLSELGKVQSARFSWESTARETLEILENAAVR